MMNKILIGISCLASLWLSSAEHNSCPIHIGECSTSKCQGENPLCSSLESWGCPQCDSGSFQNSPDYNRPCVACDTIQGCINCADWQGCTECEDSSWILQQNNDCGFHICVPQTPQPQPVPAPLPTPLPPAPTPSPNQECPYFLCPKQCNILYEHNGDPVCADLSCSQHCRYCNHDFGGNCEESSCIPGKFCPCDDDQSNSCQCHERGCDQCDMTNENLQLNYFKLNLDYPCQQCYNTFGEGCLHCSDIDGCQQCATGYTRTPAYGCGSESDNYDPNRPIYYCLPDGEEPCQSFGTFDCDCDYFMDVGHQYGAINDINVIPGLTIEECCNACHGNEECQGWTNTDETFEDNGYNGINCFLYSTPSDGVTRRNDSVSGNLIGGNSHRCRVSQEPQSPCFTCPSKCDILESNGENNEVCADTSCIEHCQYCDSNLDINNQPEECACGLDGCHQCEDGYFKLNLDYPCLQCEQVFGQGCLQCDDFLGCTNCDAANGYIFKQDCDSCGLESDHYDMYGACVGYCVHENDDCI